MSDQQDPRVLQDLTDNQGLRVIQDQQGLPGLTVSPAALALRDPRVVEASLVLTVSQDQQGWPDLKASREVRDQMDSKGPQGLQGK